VIIAVFLAPENDELFREQLGEGNGFCLGQRVAGRDSDTDGIAAQQFKMHADGIGRERPVHDGELQAAVADSQVVKAVADVRRKEARADDAARHQLEHSRWLWRKNPETWTTKEGDRWTQLKDKPLVTGLAYAMRLELQKAYAATTVAQARNRFETWCRWVRTEAEALTSGLLEPMLKAAEMVERHLAGILAHWRQGLTTAFMEGLNSLFSATKRKARGYRSIEYQTARLDFVAGKLQIPYYG